MYNPISWGGGGNLVELESYVFLLDNTRISIISSLQQIDSQPQESPDHDIYNVPRSLVSFVFVKYQHNGGLSLFIYLFIYLFISARAQYLYLYLLTFCHFYLSFCLQPIDSQLQDSPDHEIYNVPRNLVSFALQ